MNPNPHLTEAELYSLLDVKERDASEMTDTPAHLARCVQCQSELTQLRETLTGLRIATTSLAQAQNIRLTRPEVLAPSAHSSRYLFVWSAPFAIAALALSVMLTRPHHHAVTSAVATTASSTTNPSNLSDDALLEAVSQDLSISVPPSLEPLNITSSSSTSTPN